MGKKKVTFSDIAKYTNFSKTTISRYFNNPDSLTLENQQIIADALEVLDYKENKVARILASGKTEFIGVIVPNLYMHYYAEILTQILATYETFGYKFLIFTGNDREEIERKYLQELMAYQIEGLIVLSHTLSSDELASFRIPIVTIEREDEHVCSVNTDNYMGGMQATSLLAKNGCDILIHINADLSPKIPARGRIQGFLDLCKEHSLPHRLLLTDTGHSYEESIRIFSRLFEEIDAAYTGQKKGLFLPNDTFANIMLNQLFRRYGRFPDDYCLVGFDDSPISREAILPISTVGQQIDRIAVTALELLELQIQKRRKRKPEPLAEPIHKVIAPVLISRETTGAKRS